MLPEVVLDLQCWVLPALPARLRSDESLDGEGLEEEELAAEGGSEDDAVGPAVIDDGAAAVGPAAIDGGAAAVPFVVDYPAGDPAELSSDPGSPRPTSSGSSSGSSSSSSSGSD